MSPTPALKSRLSRALVKPTTSSSSKSMVVGAIRHAVVPRSHRKVSIGSDIDLSPVQLPQDPEEKEGIFLLLGISTIVQKEIASNTEIFHEDDESDESDRPQLDQYLSSLKKRPMTGSPSFLLDDENLFAWSRARTVSMDSPKSHVISPKHIPSNAVSLNFPAIVTPMGPSRLRNNVRRTSLKLVPHKGKREKVKFPKLPQLHRHQQQLQQQQQAEESVQEHHRKALEVSAERGVPLTTIHRKKFSWKNYPGTWN